MSDTEFGGRVLELFCDLRGVGATVNSRHLERIGENARELLAEALRDALDIPFGGGIQPADPLVAKRAVAFDQSRVLEVVEERCNLMREQIIEDIKRGRFT